MGLMEFDLTYINDYGHKAGILVEYDEDIYVTSYDWLGEEISTCAVVLIEDVGKLRDFLNEILES